MLPLPDAAIREEALSLNQSFIVQAPAGSGKTELLTQRFLNLLTIVQSPESVIALTFTRKAASEMKARILSILQAARHHPASLSAATLHRAKQVLTRDEQKGWHLLEATHRLKVMTLDALCQWILNILPMQSAYLGQAQIDPYPLRLYREAAKRCFEAMEPETLQLMAHLDNRQDRLMDLWIDLLASRDQWLPVLYDNKTLRHQDMEAVLQHFIQHHLNTLMECLPATLQRALCDFCRKLALHLEGYMIFQSMADMASITIEAAKALAKLLLTSTHSVRKSLDSHTGLKRSAMPKALYDDLKAESTALFSKIATFKAFIQALSEISYLPLATYSETQWEILQALFKVLPRLVAHLTLIFRESGCVDFIEVATCAKNALGHEEAPSDLALYLDYAIQHLLIDEFQDTSLSQFQLLLRLMAGFEVDDGRTVFIVGDPMQSIYRFRQAEVGLFLKVQKEGIGQKKLKPLVLSANFRSVPSLVTWVNTHFAALFPKSADIAAGAVLFNASLAHKKLDPADNPAVKPWGRDVGFGAETSIQAIEVLDKQSEAAFIIQEIQVLRASDPLETIAILARSRRQLESIILLLQENKIDFEGCDLFALSHFAVLQDLWHLTQTLLLPHEKLPWLCLFRSPYVGLSLDSLHQVAIFSDDLYASLPQIMAMETLSKDAQQRLRYVEKVFSAAFQEKDQWFLVDWVMKVHEQLYGSKRLTQENQFHVMQFMDLLAQFTVHNTILDWEMFSFYFKRLYADEVASSPLKIMTIHQAKGLEFDTVFIPGLSDRVRQLSQKLLRYTQRLQEREAPLWLISPLKPAEAVSDEVYDYLTYLERQRDDFEQQRLLYVAVTRAKKRLYLLDSHRKVQAGSFRAYLTLQDFMPFVVASSEVRLPSMCMTRLPLKHYLTETSRQVPSGELVTLALPSSQKQIGTLVHRYIQCVCEAGIETFEALPFESMAQACQNLGFIGQEQEDAMAAISLYFQHLYHTPIGQWIIQKHEQAKNEYAFTVFEDGQYKTYIVDRLFFENGTWWIIDFKTGSEAHHEAHRAQVNQYAYHLRTILQDKINSSARHPESRRDEGSPEDSTVLDTGDPSSGFAAFRMTWRATSKIACGIFYLETGHWETWTDRIHLCQNTE